MRSLRSSLTPVATIMLISACGGASQGDGTTPTGSKNEEGEVIQFADCKSAGPEIQEIDLDQDGNIEVRHVSKNGVRICSEYDPDDSGTFDSRYFYDSDGVTPKRVETAYDYGGKVDEIVYLKNGEITRKEMDTNWDKQIDLWLWCTEGVVTKAERDRDVDGRSDVWEQYKDGVITDAAYDDNGDGKPERWERFQNGSLVAIRFDLDFDGKADREEEIPKEDRGQPEDRLACVIIPDESRRPNSTSGVFGPASTLVKPENGTVEGEANQDNEEADTPSTTDENTEAPSETEKPDNADGTTSSESTDKPEAKVP